MALAPASGKGAGVQGAPRAARDGASELMKRWEFDATPDRLFHRRSQARAPGGTLVAAQDFRPSTSAIPTPETSQPITCSSSPPNANSHGKRYQIAYDASMLS